RRSAFAFACSSKWLRVGDADAAAGRPAHPRGRHWARLHVEAEAHEELAHEGAVRQLVPQQRMILQPSAGADYHAFCVDDGAEGHGAVETLASQEQQLAPARVAVER